MFLKSRMATLCAMLSCMLCIVLGSFAEGTVSVLSDENEEIHRQTGVSEAAETIRFGDVSIAADADELDLSGIPALSAVELAAKLGRMNNVKTVALQTWDIPREDMRDLLRVFPHINFDWNVTVSGFLMNSTAEKIDFGETVIADGDDLIDALTCLPRLRVLHTYASILNREQMAYLWETYPDMEFGWTLSFAKRTLRTDAVTFSTMNNSTKSPRFTGADFEVLKYCKNLVALDLGHNKIGTIDWLAELPQLRVLILADNKLEDISVLAELPNLEYVELFMNKIRDISPLANMPNLLDLNLCRTMIKSNDITPLLTNQNLQRLWISYAGLSNDQMQTLREGLPNCVMEFKATSSTAAGWRDHERYDKYREGFLTGVYVPFDGTETTRPPLPKKK